MKKVLLVLLIAILAFSFGCSKNEKTPKSKTTQETRQTGMKASIVDPVSKKPVDIAKTPYAYTYKDVQYYFESEKNMKMFKSDPEKYLAK